MRYWMAGIILLSATGYLAGQQAEGIGNPPVAPPVAADSAAIEDPFSRENLEVFVEGLVRSQFEAYHLAGVAVVIVKDDTLQLSAGFGRADLRTGRMVSPGQTLFRLGDVSKLFIWTALMQLAEENRLDLNRDVNTYLKDFKVPDAYPEPVTAADLMAHTSGLEERYLRTFLPTFSDLRPLKQALSSEFPRRVRPPGTVVAGSNYGAALAALMVEDISGQSWTDYLSSRILEPLAMEHTTIGQPLGEGRAQQLAQGYFHAEGRLERGDFEIVRLPPALGMSATAEDMGHFLVAHLQEGEFRGGRILQAETVRAMHTSLHSPEVHLPGLAHGFMTRQQNGQRIVGQTGDLLNFHCGLWIVPERQVGFFVAYNSVDGARAQADFAAALIDHWFPPAPGRPDQEPVGFLGRAKLITGSYLPTRRSFTAIDKIRDWWQYAQVKVGADGRLLTNLPGRGPQEWQEYEPFVFHDDRRRGELVFKMEPEGRVLLLQGNAPEAAFEKLPRYETPVFHLGLVSLSGLLFLSTLALPMLRWLLVRRTDEMLARRDATHPLIRSMASFLSVVNLTFLGGLLYLLPNPSILMGEVPTPLTGLLVLPVLSGALTLMLMIVTFFAWRGGYWRFAARVHYSLVTLAAVAFLWELNFWNLLGWPF